MQRAAAAMARVVLAQIVVLPLNLNALTLGERFRDATQPATQIHAEEVLQEPAVITGHALYGRMMIVLLQGVIILGMEHRVVQIRVDHYRPAVPTGSARLMEADVNF